ncbi:MAG: N-acetyltransferase [Acidobacteriota bacterium]|nr:N-acetyltransferase [Acidobacteriota bacterium]
MTDLDIANNTSASRFEVPLAGGLAVLEYRLEDGTIFLLYVEVPPAEQGRGIAGNLAHAALEFARTNRLKVVPRCPFIAAYMRKHPELLQPVH